MSTSTQNDDLLHERADSFVSSMDRTERVAWLKRQGFDDLQILNHALLDAELDEVCRDQAHGIASDAANGELIEAPAWLR